ncbi:PhnD/SsuA/transferrin family substrate-binding protein [Candidatus Poribacteria bacterium]|nr:PhnD/SsuA/transferrin family substrate-binding protein [Candidatus Poribacteria bacterium]
MARVAVWFLVWLGLLAAPGPAWAQARHDGATSGSALLRIGFLRPEGESDLTPAQMELLRGALLSDAGVSSAMKGAGFGEIGLFSADGGRDMLRRLNAGEFHLAFVPARVWAEQDAGYTIVLQTRRERDFTATRGNMVLQRGVLVVSSRSAFFGAVSFDTPGFRKYLAGQRIAVVSTQSMAGFVAPWLELAKTYGVTRPAGGVLWCESNADVAKSVISGLVDVGACEEGGLDETLASAGILDRKDALLRVVFRTVPVPTDPVVVHPMLAPRSSALGRELKRAVRTFSLNAGFGSVSLQNAQDEDYRDIRDLLRQYADTVGEIGR